ncbi:hypothetical protein [Magnetofaba australis]|uniref:Tetratricopeptide repeat protein n=1 Tax=Magnetofaba australis IT-1 TaxID=1434232 RepID=A0A1Y2K5F4_9PROT|nr:hypothetical protein [Magnetofaba australis]OSM04922.1 hypothetical protein MAIT1_03030 [Magnetofaba australis IT-1]
MKSAIFTAIILAMMGVSISTALIPSEETLAYLHLKDKEFDSALEFYEQQVDDQNVPPHVLMPLAQLYLQNGDVERAVSLMERFLLIPKNQNNVEALRQVAVYYQYAQRPEMYLKTLEKLTALNASTNDLEKLSQLYSNTGDINKQISILERLAILTPDNVKIRQDLTRLYAANNDKQKATETLQALWASQPPAIDGFYLELWVNLLLDLKQPDQAAQIITEWRDRQKNDDANHLTVIARACNLMHYQDYDDQAWKVLQPYAETPFIHRDILASLTQVMPRVGQGSVLFAHMQTAYENGSLAATSLGDLADLAFVQEENAFLFDLLASRDQFTLPEWLQLAIAERALDEAQPPLQRAARANIAWDRLQPHLKEMHPALAAELAWASNQSQLANAYLDKALASSAVSAALNPKDQLRLAGLLVGFGRKTEGLAIVAKLARHADTPAWMLRELAARFVEEKSVDKGYALFTELRKTRREPQVDAGWALLSLAAKRSSQVEQWLATDPKLDEADLNDLAFVAIDNGHSALGERLSKRLYAQQHTAANRRLFINALLASGDAHQALLLARPWRDSSSKEDRDLYEASLFAVKARGGDIDRELIAVIKARINDPKLDPQERRNLAFALMDAKAYRKAKIAFQMLAQDADPDSVDLAQLLFLWGPRPDKEAIAWLEQRARAEQSDPAKRAAWVNHLTQLGAADRAALVVEARMPPAGQGGVLLDRYIEALVELNDTARLDKALRREIPRVNDVKQLKALSTIAEAQNLPLTAAIGYDRVLSLSHDDELALKRLGYMAFFAGRWQEVESYLGRYLALYLEQADYEAHFYLAEVLWAENRKKRADVHYMHALEKLDKVSDKPFPVRLTYARMLNRIGRVPEALQAYRALYAEQPENANLQMDFIELLIDQNLTDEASRVVVSAKR